jgi:hypothetical protein
MGSPSMQRELVISSDALGMTCSVNRGIEAAARKGLLTSTHFMVPGTWFEHAVCRFRDAPVDLGVHLTLTCEWDNYRWRPLSHGKTLVDRSGYLYPTIAELMAHASAEEIRSECRQQLSLALDSGLLIVYADLHMCFPTLERDESCGPPRLLNDDHELSLYRWAQPYRTADLECIGSTWFRELLERCEIELVGMPFCAMRSRPRRESAWNLKQ